MKRWEVCWSYWRCWFRDSRSKVQGPINGVNWSMEKTSTLLYFLTFHEGGKTRAASRAQKGDHWIDWWGLWKEAFKCSLNDAKGRGLEISFHASIKLHIWRLFVHGIILPYYKDTFQLSNASSPREGLEVSYMIVALYNGTSSLKGWASRYVFYSNFE